MTPYTKAIGVVLFCLQLAIAAGAQLPRGFLRGGDVSEIPQVEDAGGKYYLDGQAMDPFQLMKKEGWNFVRFRVWNHPFDGYCDKDHTLALAKRAAALGFKISIDFHYSDWWADPGKQNKPAVWKDLPFDQLTKALHDFTKDVVSALVRQGTPPYMVQIGNEITAGMLWPDGHVTSSDPGQWHKLGALIQAGIDGVHDAENGHKILTMIHLDRGGDNKGATWWFDNLAKQGVNFDLIGLSYYPYWHGHLDALQANLIDLANRYRKPIYVVETGYAWTSVTNRGGNGGFNQRLEEGYPATPEGQAGFLSRVEQIILQTPHGLGKGLLYWAPAWIPTPKNPQGWGNLALFDFKGNALPGVAAMGGKWKPTAGAPR